MSADREYAALSEGMDSEADACADVLAASFGMAPEDARAWVARATLPKMRVVRAGGDISGCLNVFEMGHWFGGESVSSGAISAVGVAPEQRGRGVASELMAGVLRELAASGVALSTLYPASWPLYRSLGYELAGVRARIEIPVHRLPRHKPTLSVRLATDADQSAIVRCHETFSRGRDASVHKAPENWMRVQYPRGVRSKQYLFEDGDEVVAYAFVKLESSSVRQTMYDLQVLDVAVTDQRFVPDVLAFLAQSSTLANAAVVFGGLDHPFLAQLPDRFFSLALADEWMLRIVDIEAAFVQRRYPDGTAAEMHFDVRDSVLAGNVGRRVVRVEGGRATVEKGGRGSVRADIRALAALYTGHIRPETLVALGVLDGDADEIAEVERALAVRAPSMVDMF